MPSNPLCSSIFPNVMMSHVAKEKDLGTSSGCHSNLPEIRLFCFLFFLFIYLLFYLFRLFHFGHFVSLFQVVHAVKSPFLGMDTGSGETINSMGKNMQMCHSLRCKQIDMSTADQLKSFFPSNAGGTCTCNQVKSG